jgi:hypothetical protein
MTRVYEEIVDFIAAGSTPAAVATWTPSAAARERLTALLAAERAGTLAPDDRAELAHCMELEHLLRLTKVRAR